MPNFAIFLTFACSISINEASNGSKEEALRLQLTEIHQLSSKMERCAYQIESLIDEIRRNPNEQQRTIDELNIQFDQLEKQHRLLQQSIEDWEAALMVSRE